MRTMDGNLNKRQFYPYTIYTNQNHEYHAENLIFYSIEQTGLFTTTDAGRHPHKDPPMGSRLASLLLSVRACGGSQGKSPAKCHFRAENPEFCENRGV